MSNLDNANMSVTRDEDGNMHRADIIAAVNKARFTLRGLREANNY